MIQPKKLLLIDSATSGCAGAYIDGIYQNLSNKDLVEVAVSYYFPYVYGQKIFFKYSELAAQKHYRLGRARLYVRFLELVAAFAMLYRYVRAAHVEVVCYALSSNLFVEYLFLSAVRRFTKARIYIICHDVIPFVLPGQEFSAMLKKRAKFYRLADKLLVHNENSVRELVESTGTPTDKIEQFPFPLYDLRKMCSKGAPAIPETSSLVRFLFIGHLRPEKGVDVLLAAWRLFARREPAAELLIAGNVPAGCRYDFDSVRDQRVTLALGYLDDGQYADLIRRAHCVILPYVRGTNSAVVSSVLALRRNVIVSDIEMFKNNPLIPSESFFPSEDCNALAGRIAYFFDLGRERQLLASPRSDRRFRAYDRVFNRRVNALFERTLLPTR
jgi:glycosyltransferase involved in cell wall biosynthesis